MLEGITNFFGTLVVIVSGFIGIVFALVIAGMLFLGGC